MSLIYFDHLIGPTPRFDTKKFKQGDTVIKQGEPGTSFFVIAQGELEVFIKDAQGEEKRARNWDLLREICLKDLPSVRKSM